MKLEINYLAPNFSREDVFGRQVDLSAYSGRKLLLAFFRHAGCPFCNLRVHTLMKDYEKLRDAGMDMVFVFESMKRVILRSSFHQEISPIPLIADPERELYSAFGLEQDNVKAVLSHLRSYIPTAIQAMKKGVPNYYMKGEEAMSTLPAEFLIDENTVIRSLKYSTSLTDRMSMEEIHAFAGI